MSDTYLASFRCDPAAGSSSFTDYAAALNWLAQNVTLPLDKAAALMRGLGQGRTTTVDIPGGTATIEPPQARPEKVDLMKLMDDSMDGWDTDAAEFKALHAAKLALTDLLNAGKAVIPLLTEACSGQVATSLREDAVRRKDTFCEALARVLP